MRKNKIGFRSEKGAAIVLVAVLVTGIVMLVSVIAIENLRKSTQLQGIQKRSLDSLYKAEEGAEYGLFVNKEKRGESFERPFEISVWEKIGSDTVVKEDEQALEQLAQPTEGRNIVVTSQNNQNSGPQRTVFTNLPNKYQNQVTLWNVMEGCGDACSVSYEGDNDEKTYRVIVTNSVFERSSWSDSNWEYRLVFKCGESSYWRGNLPGTQTTSGCTVSEVKLFFGNEDECTYSQCNFTGCDQTFDDITFGAGEASSMEGKIIPTNWFQAVDGSGSRINLTNKKIIVEFKLKGIAETVNFGPNQSDTTMCEQQSTAWIDRSPMRIGMASFEVRKGR